MGDPQTGSVEILSGEIAEDLTRYLFYSEQTPSAVSLGVMVDTDLSVLAAGGFIVQPLPEASYFRFQLRLSCEGLSYLAGSADHCS